MRTALICTAALLAGCAGGDEAGGSGGDASLEYGTLDGGPPMIIAHRGSAGTGAEESLEVYRAAVAAGVSVLEFDLIATKDHELIARHDPNLGLSTDVATRSEFADRKRMAKVDNATQEGWFASDFTLAEIKTLVATGHGKGSEHAGGSARVATLGELIAFTKAATESSGRTIRIYVETKNPSYHRDMGLPLEEKLIDALDTAGWNSRSAPVVIQSFEPSSLKRMRKRSQALMVQLIDADDVDLVTGELVYRLYNRPYDWTAAGDDRLFSSMVTSDGLAEIKKYADGIGPWKRYIVPVKGVLDEGGAPKDLNGDGKVGWPDTVTQPPTSLVQDAHAAGLFVHPFTFRNPASRLPSDYAGDPKAEYRQFFALGVDGVFTDYAHTALEALEEHTRKLRSGD